MSYRLIFIAVTALAEEKFGTQKTKDNRLFLLG